MFDRLIVGSDPLLAALYLGTRWPGFRFHRLDNDDASMVCHSRARRESGARRTFDRYTVKSNPLPAASYLDSLAGPDPLLGVSLFQYLGIRLRRISNLLCHRHILLVVETELLFTANVAHHNSIETKAHTFHTFNASAFCLDIKPRVQSNSVFTQRRWSTPTVRRKRSTRQVDRDRFKSEQLYCLRFLV